MLVIGTLLDTFQLLDMLLGAILICLVSVVAMDCDDDDNVDCFCVRACSTISLDFIDKRFRIRMHLLTSTPDDDCSQDRC